LRSLSLSGELGNAWAIVLYFAVCLLPIVVFFILRRKRKTQAEDGLLWALSAMLFAVMYTMINPGVLNKLTDGVFVQSIGKVIMGSVVYSILCGYVTLRILRLFSRGGTDKLARYLSYMLRLANAYFVYLIFGVCFEWLHGSLVVLQAENASNDHLLGARYVFLILQFTVTVLPYIFDILVVFAALHLLEEMRLNRYSVKTEAAAGRISRLCTLALVTTILVNIGFNVVQLAFVKKFMAINSSLQVPVYSITFVLIMLLFARYVTENKELKEENDMFV